MTRTQAERIAADRNKGTERGVSYYARMYVTGRWYVVGNDNGYERIVAS